MSEMPYMAPRAGMSRQSTRWRMEAASFVSKVCSDDAVGESRPCSTFSMWLIASSLVVVFVIVLNRRARLDEEVLRRRTRGY